MSRHAPLFPKYRVSPLGLGRTAVCGPRFDPADAICDDAAMTEFLNDLETCVARVVAHAQGTLRMATPLGLGKPNVLLNAI